MIKKLRKVEINLIEIVYCDFLGNVLRYLIYLLIIFCRVIVL